MIIQAIKSAHDPLSYSINNLYVEAFPVAERKPLETLYSHQQTGYCDVFAITEDDGRFVGMITTIKGDGLIMVEYFAIAPDCRGKGYGSKILGLLQEEYTSTPICLEIEDTQDRQAKNYEQRQARLRFYLANGFQQLNWVVSYFGVPVEVLATQAGIEYADYIKLYEPFYEDDTQKLIYFIEDRR